MKPLYSALKPVQTSHLLCLEATKGPVISNVAESSGFSNWWSLFLVQKLVSWCLLPLLETWFSSNQFSCSWYFWKARVMYYNFHVEHFEIFSLDHGEIWPLKLDIKAEKTLRKISKCLGNFTNLGTLLSLMPWENGEIFWTIIFSHVAVSCMNLN